MEGNDRTGEAAALTGAPDTVSTEYRRRFNLFYDDAETDLVIGHLCVCAAYENAHFRKAR